MLYRELDSSQKVKSEFHSQARKVELYYQHFTLTCNMVIPLSSHLSDTPLIWYVCMYSEFSLLGTAVDYLA